MGYRGLVDVDFRLDPRDGIYKLLDFNPRMGAASRVFRSSAGLDLVQIALLDLVGHSPTAGAAVRGSAARRISTRAARFAYPQS